MVTFSVQHKELLTAPKVHVSCRSLLINFNLKRNKIMNAFISNTKYKFKQQRKRKLFQLVHKEFIKNLN